MHLVDDIHAVTPALRRILDLFAQVADLVDAIVAGCIDLQNIQIVFLRQGQA